MLYFVVPFITGNVIGFIGAQSKKLLPLALIAIIGAILIWATQVMPLFNINQVIESSGLQRALDALWTKANPAERQMLYLGLAGLPVGYIGGRLLRSVNANGKLESKSDRKRRILTEHGMREFD